MKTEVIRHRPFLNFSVRQYHKTGFMNCNDALAAVNEVRLGNGFAEKRIDKFFENDHSEYLVALCKYLNSESFSNTPKSGDLKPADLVKVKRGRYGGTWLHPYYYTKFARWLSPEFEAMVDIWVSDNLLFLRDSGGDAFKRVNRKLDMKFDIGSKHWEYAKVAKLTAKRVLGNETPDQWNFADRDQLHERDRFLYKLEYAAEYGNFQSIDDLIKAV